MRYQQTFEGHGQALEGIPLREVGSILIICVSNLRNRIYRRSNVWPENSGFFSFVLENLVWQVGKFWHHKVFNTRGRGQYSLSNMTTLNMHYNASICCAFFPNFFDHPSPETKGLPGEEHKLLFKLSIYNAKSG